MNNQKNILIVGAGVAGELLKKDIEKNQIECQIIGFVDDYETGSDRLNILGKIDEMPKIIDLYNVNEIVIAIPSADGGLVRRIMLANERNRIPIKIVPRDQKVISYDDVKYLEAKGVDFEDFLGRPFVKKNVRELKKFYRGKKILITGGAGSIGSEIVKQLLSLDTKKIIVYDNSEYLTFNLDQNLHERGINKNQYKLVIGNILNKIKLEILVRTEKPDMILHAAAYKHVCLMEDNPDEAVLNNVVGTKTLIDIAIKNGIKHFVFISTDKVVNPTSVMGLTKKIGEFYIKKVSRGSRTIFTIVRFGNVINSNGSVLPLFERQIEDNSYITVTHKKVMRYFMSIREAANLVIESTSNDKKGNIFILNMGELISIYQVAKCVIRSKCLLTGEDVAIKFIGLKKGEKLVEELMTEKEKNNLAKTKMEDIFCLKNLDKCQVNLDTTIAKLEKMALSGNNKELSSFLKGIFPPVKLKK